MNFKISLFLLGLCSHFQLMASAGHDQDNTAADMAWSSQIFAQLGWYQNSRNADSWQVPGFITGNDAGPHEQGLQLFHGEWQVQADLDKQLAASMILSSHSAEAIELEELWLQPYLGHHWQMRLGRQAYNIGLHNQLHSHDLRFIDENLPEQVFLGGQYRDDGLELRWSPDNNELSVWLARGAQFPAQHDQNSATPAAMGSSYRYQWLGSNSRFSLKAGISYFNASQRNQQDDASHSHSNNSPLIFDGNSYLYNVGGQWQWLSLGWDWQWMLRDEEGELIDEQQFTAQYQSLNHGLWSEWYWQWPTLELALRYERLKSDNQLTNLSQDNLNFSSGLNAQSHNPQRLSTIINWQVTAQQMLRLQMSYDQTQKQEETALWLMYQGALKASW